MKRKYIVLFLIGCFLGFGLLTKQIRADVSSYTLLDKTPSTPILASGVNIRYPSLVGDKSDMRLWYENRLMSSAIYMRTSTTGYKGFGDEVATVGLTGLTHPRIYSSGSGYIGFFEDATKTAPNSIQKLTSTDGINWSNQTQIVIDNTPYSTAIIWGVVAYFENVSGDTDVLYFTQSTGANEKIYRATATDGINFTYQGTAFENPGGVYGAGVSVGSQIVFDSLNSKYLLIWSGESTVGNIGYATSSDGITFTNQGTVVTSISGHNDLQESSFIINGSDIIGIYTGDFGGVTNNNIGALGSLNSVIYVDDDWNGSTVGTTVSPGKVFGDNAFSTIQTGVSAVSIGGSVNVAAGNYTGQVSLSKTVVISGPNVDRDPNTEDGDNDEDDRLSEAVINGLVSVSSANDKIQGFTITNPTGKQGIVMSNQNGLVIKNNIINNIGSSDVTTSGMNSGISVSSSTAAIDGLTITNNKISNIVGGNKKTAHGMIVGFSNGNFNINNLLISENVIDEISSDISDYSTGGRGAYGILLNHAASPATGTTPNAVISKNTITNLEGLWAHGIGMEGNLPNAEISENTINNLTDHKTPTDSVGIYFEVNPGANSTTVEDNNFGSEMGLAIKNTMEGLTVNAKNNWWGTRTLAGVTAKVSGEVDFVPYYTKESKINTSVDTDDDENINTNTKSDMVVIGNTDENVSITISDDAPDDVQLDFSTLIDSGSVVVPEIHLTSEKTNNVSIAIPASTTITSSNSDWDGTFAAPVVTTITLPQTSGETRTLGMAIEVGLGDTQLSFDKAVRINFPNQAGKRVGFLRNDVFHEITVACDGDYGDDLNEDNDGDEDDQECKVNIGNDLVVWTRHFTKFATFDSTSTTSSTTSTGGGGGWVAPVCSATKPGSAPTITSTVGGDNSVTLTWSKAKDPVTNYLVAYGNKSGSIEYGNPNVGNSDTTSYTIKGLSGGTRYYFKIKAINDCMPGDWSNEMSATPGGRIIEATSVSGTTPAEGFTPVSELPSQLFDIALIVDQTKLTKAADLLARVTFISFGREDTPVEMTFTVIDENGKEYYRSVDKTTIQTEGVFNKTFPDLILAKGKYTLVLTTLYNTNVKDEFKQDFEIGETTSPTPNKLLMISIGSVVMVGLIVIIIIIKKRKKKK